MAKLSLIPPPPALSNWVNYCWASDGAGGESGPVTYRILADGLPALIVQQYEGRSMVADQHGSRLPTSFVYGQATTAFTNFAQSRMSVVGVSLKPHSLPLLFRAKASEFTNRLIALDELADYGVNDRLLNANNLNETIDILSAFLTRRSIHGLRAILLSRIASLG